MTPAYDVPLIEPGAENIFRLENGQELRLHRHQRQAIEAARTGKSYVLTTGTGSAIPRIYDEMAAAKRSGTDYQTPLTPPPGQGPRHPAR
jgi:hypothetical protein